VTDEPEALAEDEGQEVAAPSNDEGFINLSPQLARGVAAAYAGYTPRILVSEPYEEDMLRTSRQVRFGSSVTTISDEVLAEMAALMGHSQQSVADMVIAFDQAGQAARAAGETVGNMAQWTSPRPQPLATVRHPDEKVGDVSHRYCRINWIASDHTCDFTVTIYPHEDMEQMHVHRVRAAMNHLGGLIEIMDSRLRQAQAVDVTEHQHVGLRAFFSFMANELNDLYHHARQERQRSLMEISGGAECDVIKWAMGGEGPINVVTVLHEVGIAIELAHIEPWRMYEQVPRRMDSECRLGAVAVVPVGRGEEAVECLQGCMGVPALVVYSGKPDIPAIVDMDQGMMTEDRELAGSADPFAVVDV